MNSNNLNKDLGSIHNKQILKSLLSIFVMVVLVLTGTLVHKKNEIEIAEEEVISIKEDEIKVKEVIEEEEELTKEDEEEVKLIKERLERERKERELEKQQEELERIERNKKRANEIVELHVSRSREKKLAKVEKEQQQQPVEANPVVHLSGRGMEVPNIDTQQKTYMSYTVYERPTPQKTIQENATNDNHGFRRAQNGDYLVALGTYYGNLGDRFRITLDTGRVFNATMGEWKANQHTDPTNRFVVRSPDPETGAQRGNLIEFIIDPSTLDPVSKRKGDVSYANNRMFWGNVTSIEKLE